MTKFKVIVTYERDGVVVDDFVLHADRRKVVEEVKEGLYERGFCFCDFCEEIFPDEVVREVEDGGRVGDLACPECAKKYEAAR